MKSSDKYIDRIFKAFGLGNVVVPKKDIKEALNKCYEDGFTDGYNEAWIRKTKLKY